MVEDIVIQNDEIISVGELNKSAKHLLEYNFSNVSVIGEIYVPTSHLFQSGNTVNEYISLSGGAKEMTADLDNVYVIKANGSVQLPGSQSGFFRTKSGFIESGDTIVVPLDIAIL